MSHKILTVSGREVDPFEMTIDDIDIMDIAHSLSMQCRFAGHVPSFYSVAEHCVRAVQLLAASRDLAVEQLRGDRIARSLLLHDADEAYLQDLVKPVKSRPELATYLNAGDRLHGLVAEKFDCEPLRPDGKHHQTVLSYDVITYEWERDNVRTGRLAGLPPEEAKAAFLGMWYLTRPSTYG